MGVDIAEWHVRDLVGLVRRRYPTWDGFEHAAFLTDEAAPKRAAAQRFQEQLGQDAWDGLLRDGRQAEILQRLRRVAGGSNLLFNRVPQQGDMRLLHDDRLDQAALAHQLRALVHGSDPTPARFDALAHFVFEQRRSALKWPLPTLLLFLHEPAAEFFVQPRPVAWLLSFVGHDDRYTTTPHGAAYSAIRDVARALGDALAAYAPHDLIDVQSFIWVAARESVRRTGGLTPQDQVDLDVPQALYAAGQPAGRLLRERAVGDTDYTQKAAAAMESDPIPATLTDLAAVTHIAPERLADWVDAVERKRQAVFYGPPGTGKTFLARHLARYLVGGGDGFVELLQFHPAFAYEDFIQGIRPVARAGQVRYETQPGRFLAFCRAAAQRTGRCVLVIDEMNRADLPQVFGELLYLLEYRDQDIPLAGGGTLRIPANVRLLGTMNSADRSIALVDYALRRRFAFIELAPDYEVLRRFHVATPSAYDPEPLIALLRRVNDQIGDPHYAVGISYFLLPDLANQLKAVWRMEIEPYLAEYFFDQPEVVAPFRWESVASDLSHGD